ncbi:DUF3291 domain-containing protein [Parvularcula maris]|uniref:DUF3291 domain-containing protein n=1 Tax=Parvularcula maris TaxID=2965077 RepID=A0A9X2L753_9PROT|nr:DUF3291 domain-containing protein [Parvularcula maris]MCQ8184196.1 DUF3291 domain-containing protein [Parvularcula maris]
MEQPEGTHLAEINIGRTKGTVDDPVMKEFFDRVDAINALAERSPGFVWRMTGEGNHAMDVRWTPDPLDAVNLSVWETPADLANYVWKTAHQHVYNRKAEWFVPSEKPHFVMWWVPIGHLPSLDEAVGRLEQYRAHGPSDQAFGWQELPEAKLFRERRCA